MGKTYKWFRGLFGQKKFDSSSKQPPPKKKWSFKSKSREPDNDHHVYQNVVFRSEADPSNGFSGLAAASVLGDQSSCRRGTNRSSGGGGGAVSNRRVGYGRREKRAAVLIQSHFRAFLSRKALRALKALVKLQALARGHLVRKQTADVLRRMQALLRAQARARAERFLIYETQHCTKASSYPGPETPEKVEPVMRFRNPRHEQQMILKRNGSKSYRGVVFDEEKTRMNPSKTSSKPGEGPFARDEERTEKSQRGYKDKQGMSTKRSIIHASQHNQSCRVLSGSTTNQAVFPTSDEVPLEFSGICSAENSSQFYSASSIGASSRREVFTTARSEGSRRYLSRLFYHPNYMAYTKSSRAKARSASAPKQRPPQDQRCNSTKRCSVLGNDGFKFNTQKVSALEGNFINRAYYPGSGRLDRIERPFGEDANSFGSNQCYST